TAEDACSAFMAASDAVARSVKRSVARTGSRGRRHAADASKTGKKRPPKRRAAPAGSDDGRLIGRRVGRSAANLQRAAARPEKQRRDVPVDTSAPGRSATDRRVGATATATRNTKLNRSGMTAALEDSATGKPSRKSTRR